MPAKLTVGISVDGVEERPDDDGTDPFHALDPDRAKQKAYAEDNGYFWLPCSRCGRWSGGHEWAALMKAGADNVKCARSASTYHGACCRRPANVAKDEPEKDACDRAHAVDGE